MDKTQRLPLLNSYIETWAEKKPDEPAMIQNTHKYIPVAQ
jgi:hypothetical protein